MAPTPLAPPPLQALPPPPPLPPRPPPTTRTTTTTTSGGAAAFALSHCCAIIVCFPATILFEYAAGFVFGLYQGSCIVWIAKVSAACVTFFLAKGVAALADGSASGTDEGDANPLKSAAEARTGSTATVTATAAATAQGWRDGLVQRLEGVASGAREDGLRFTLLARLSPLPSWANNYGLALAGVPFQQYLPATIIASIPPIAVHCSTGAAAASLAMATAGGGGVGGGDSGGAVLGALGIGSAGLLVQTAIERAATRGEGSAEESTEGKGGAGGDR